MISLLNKKLFSMKKQKTIYVRATKVANKRYLIEQRRTFMWKWVFWQKGCPTLGIGKYLSSKQAVKNAVQTKAAAKNLRPVIIIQ